MSHSRTDKKVANSFIALSSAAVLAVYSAGFFRTRAAAEQVEALESRVRPGMSAARGEVQPAALSAPVASQASAPVSPPPVPAALAASIIAKADTPAPAASAKKLAEAAPAPLTAAVPEPKPEIKPEVVVAAPLPLPAPVPAAPVPAPVEVTPAAPAATLPPAPVPATPAQPTWKDGTYLGWGDARHGSIQAAVDVKGGHISAARIEQCAMRYSCNVIETLIPQVAQRGNPEKIDYISGATESSNVFYWALVDALSKAK